MLFIQFVGIFFAIIEQVDRFLKKLLDGFVIVILVLQWTFLVALQFRLGVCISFFRHLQNI